MKIFKLENLLSRIIINYTRHNFSKRNEKYDYDFIRTYTTDFVYKLLTDQKIEKILEEHYNIDKCLITQETLDMVEYNDIVYKKSVRFSVY